LLCSGVYEVEAEFAYYHKMAYPKQKAKSCDSIYLNDI